MTPISYCEHKVARRGGTFYYSLLKISPKLRAAIITIKTIYFELFDCLIDCQEVAVARLRLQWWRDEINKAFTNSASHPAALSLSQISNLLEKKLLLEMVNGFESFLDYPLFEKQEDVFHFLARTAGIREWLIAQAIGSREYKMEDFFRFGAGIEMIHHIRNMRRLAEKGFFFFCQSDLDRFNCTPELIAKMKMTEAVKQFVAAQCDYAKQYLTQEIKLPYFQPYRKLMLVYLEEIKADQYQVLNRYIKLNPLRKLWISWRS